MSGSISFTFTAPNLSEISMPLSAWVLLVLYLAFGLITFGHYIRSHHARGRLSTLIRALIYGSTWPVYWLAFIGPVNTVSVISLAISQVRTELLVIYYSLALIFVPAYLLYFNWDRCNAFGSCVGTLAKAFITGLVWPILIVVKLAEL